MIACGAGTKQLQRDNEPWVWKFVGKYQLYGMALYISQTDESESPSCLNLILKQEYTK